MRPATNRHAAPSADAISPSGAKSKPGQRFLNEAQTSRIGAFAERVGMRQALRSYLHEFVSLGQRRIYPRRRLNFGIQARRAAIRKEGEGECTTGASDDGSRCWQDQSSMRCFVQLGG
jgi:hypothetical protein